MCNWAESYMTESKGSRFCERYTNMIYRLNDSFGREQCRFFDPSVKFGGPNPDETDEMPTIPQMTPVEKVLMKTLAMKNLWLAWN